MSGVHDSSPSERTDGSAQGWTIAACTHAVDAPTDLYVILLKRDNLLILW